MRWLPVINCTCDLVFWLVTLFWYKHNYFVLSYLLCYKQLYEIGTRFSNKKSRGSVIDLVQAVFLNAYRLLRLLRMLGACMDPAHLLMLAVNLAFLGPGLLLDVLLVVS